MAKVTEAPRTWGGPRTPGRGKRLGRKPAGKQPQVAHARRPVLDGKRHPVHVTVRVVPGVKYLRGFRIYPVIRRALCAASDRMGMRIVHYSVQGNHIHLIVEAADRGALSRGMKGLGVRVARRLNQAAERTGRVLADRYHAHYLKTPTEVRHALVYVLQNGAKHGSNHQRAPARWWFDPFSSAAYFRGWSENCQRWVPARDAPGNPLHREAKGEQPVTEPSVWLLRVGWQRAGGPIEQWERPRA
jgi:REP element-mobilizing transposase RayT